MALVELYPKQRAAAFGATSRLNLWHGSVRSGKTVASQVAWIDFVLHGPPGPLLMVGKTERTLRRNVLVPLEEMLGPRRVVPRSGDGEATILGRRVYLAGANDERAETKVRGLTLAGAYGDEVSTWPRSFAAMLFTRLSVPGAKFFGTTNPDAPLHWLKKEYIDRAGKIDIKAFHFKLRDNVYLSREYLDAVETENVGLWKKRFIDGLWAAAEGAIYDMLDLDVAGFDELPRDLRLERSFASVDYGTSNPFVAGRYVVDGDGTTWRVGEWRWDSREAGRQMTDLQYRDALVAWNAETAAAHPDWPTPEVWWVDPSAASFIAELRGAGFNVAPAVNDVVDGIRHVSSRIALGTVRLARAHGTTCDELSSYAWDPKAQEKGKDEPIKSNDHGPDEIRYGLYSDALGGGDGEDVGWV